MEEHLDDNLYIYIYIYIYSGSTYEDIIVSSGNEWDSDNDDSEK